MKVVDHLSDFSSWFRKWVGCVRGEDGDRVWNDRSQWSVKGKETEARRTPATPQPRHYPNIPDPDNRRDNFFIAGYLGLTYLQQTPLQVATFLERLTIGQRLLDRGADVDAQEIDGWTPLYIAAQTGQLGLARMLFERGAAINTSSRHGVAPLHVASEMGHLKVVRLLLEHSAGFNARNKCGGTPSKIASICSMQESEGIQSLSD